jgi:Fic family protein
VDKSVFTPTAPGNFWEISVEGRKDWAFVPHPLSDLWELSDDIWELLAHAREELGRLDGIGRYMPNYNLLLRPLQRREALRSSSLEGTYATPQQLLLFEIDPRTPQSDKDPINSWQEVWNYNRALDLALEILEERELSLNVIRDIHQTLLSGVRGFQKEPGRFRDSQVHIGSERRFIPPPPHEIMPCLYEFEKFIQKQNNIDPLITCFMAHYQFETIHPFYDGNGRVGRLILSLMLYQRCKLGKPWLYMSAFFDRYKDEYIDLLFQVSTTGNWQDWVKFCLRGVIEQSRDAVNRFDQLLHLRNQYMELLNHAGGHIRLNRLIEHLFESPAITIRQFSDMCNIQYNTARADIEKLVSNGILSESTLSSRPKIYFASEILEIAYGN